MYQQKNLLFYSARCVHCKELLQKIIFLNKRNEYTFVSVDKGLKIPSFVDRVPTILTIDKRVLVNDDIDLYLQRSSSDSQQNQNDNGEAGEVLPFTMGQTMNVDQYAYITDDGNSYQVDDSHILNNGIKEMMHNRNWVSLEDDSHIDVSVSATSSGSTSKNKHFDDKFYENYMDSRKKEEEQIKKILTTQAVSQNMQPAFVR